MYSFCIITDNQEPQKLNDLIKSIRSQGMEHEILISVDKDKSGRLGMLRNKACRQAQGDILIVLDDDMVLHDCFYSGLKRYGNDFDVLSCVILNPDGSRYWDWKVNKNGLNWLLDYGDIEESVSITGGLCIMKREVFESVQWDNERGFYKDEDVDFSDRLKRAGFRIDFNPWSTVTHNGPYTQKGIGVFRTDGK